MKAVLALLVTTALVWAAAPTAAGADDRSLREAGRSRDATFEELGSKTRRAFRVWVNSGYASRPARRVVRLLRAARGQLDLVVAAVMAEQPSSAFGERYKYLLLVSMEEFDRSLAWQARGVQARTRGRLVRARRAFERSDALFRRSARHQRQAVEAIRNVVPD